MALSAPVRLRVDDPSGVAPVRRAAEQLADDLGFDEQLKGETAIVVTELATNLVRHAGGGEIILRINRAGAPGIDAISTDRGPGIADLGRAHDDGYSTRGGAGNGLGAIARMSATMDLHSRPGEGTVIVARLASSPTIPDVDGIALALAGERASGDAWTHVTTGDATTILLADGLGHGDDAARAANGALRELDGTLDAPMALERIHRALRPTRGAAAAIARLDRRARTLRYVGVGNIAAVLIDGERARSLVSMPGIVGHGMPRIRAYDYELPPDGLLVMHSDGCRSGWDLSAYPGARRRDPLVLAGLLIRDFERGRDDVSVVVART